MEKLLSKIINESAEQAKLFIGLDELSSTSIVDEIIKDKDISSKLTKLLRLLLDRLRFQALGTPQDTSKLDKLLENLQIIDPTTPDSTEKLFQWIPSKVLQQKNLLKQMAKQIAKHEENSALVEKTMKEIGEQVSISKQKYKDKIKELQQDVSNLRQNLYSRDEENSQKLRDTENLISELKTANSNLEKKIFDLHVTINSLNKENSQLKEKIEGKPKANFLDVDKEELIHEIEKLQKRLKKAEKLQTHHIKQHKQLIKPKRTTKTKQIKHSHHYHYETSSEESDSSSEIQFTETDSDSIDSNLSDSTSTISSSSSSSYQRSSKEHRHSKPTKRKNEHKQRKCCSCCNCKCHKIDLNSLRKKYGKLESDVDDLQKEISSNF